MNFHLTETGIKTEIISQNNSEIEMEMITRDHPYMMSTQMEGRGQAQGTHVDGEGISSMWTSTKKLEPTDVTLSSSPAKKFVFLYQIFPFGWNKKCKFIVNINQYHKLLIVQF